MLYRGWKWRFRAMYNAQKYKPKDLAGNKQILQKESSHCFLMESASSLISTCTDNGNRFRHLKVTAFKNICNRFNGISSTSTSISLPHFHSNIGMTANYDYHTPNTRLCIFFLSIN
jgi:hypothetical protein